MCSRFSAAARLGLCVLVGLLCTGCPGMDTRSFLFETYEKTVHIGSWRLNEPILYEDAQGDSLATAGSKLYALVFGRSMTYLGPDPIAIPPEDSARIRFADYRQLDPEGAVFMADSARIMRADGSLLQMMTGDHVLVTDYPVKGDYLTAVIPDSLNVVYLAMTLALRDTTDGNVRYSQPVSLKMIRAEEKWIQDR